jgi:hypothetical protein
MKRRDFIAGLGSGVAAWPVVARASVDSTPLKVVLYEGKGAPGERALNDAFAAWGQ